MYLDMFIRIISMSCEWENELMKWAEYLVADMNLGKYLYKQYNNFKFIGHVSWNNSYH